MRYVDEYRDERVARALVAGLAKQVTRPWVLIEICGGQTHAIVRYGLDRLIPPLGPARPRTRVSRLRH